MTKTKKQARSFYSTRRLLYLIGILLLCALIGNNVVSTYFQHKNSSADPSKSTESKGELLKVGPADTGEISMGVKDKNSTNTPQPAITPVSQSQQNKSSLPDHWWEQYLSTPAPSTPMPDFSTRESTPSPSPAYSPPTSSCTFVSISGSSKAHYACAYGSYPPCSPYKAIAPYDHTKNLYECS